MARIRSVHPGLFTDEGFMALSAIARVLLIGIWVESDDQGIFEWKPLTLKARLLPVDMVDMAELFVELVNAQFVQQFCHGEKFYGAVRNFRKYQRPKKPNEVYPLPNELRTYVGLTAQSSPPVPHQFPTSGEKSPQMEDGGGRMEEIKERVLAAIASPPEPFLIIQPAPIRRKTQLPADWDLPPDWRLWVEENHPAINADDQAARFKDYWHGEGKVKADWQATWRNWIRNAKGYSNGKRDGKLSDVEILSGVAARLEETHSH